MPNKPSQDSANNYSSEIVTSSVWRPNGSLDSSTSQPVNPEIHNYADTIDTGMPECSNSVVILDLELPVINAGGPNDCQMCDFVQLGDNVLLFMVVPASEDINRDVSPMHILPEVENYVQKIGVQNRQTCNSNNIATVMARDEPPFPESSADEIKFCKEQRSYVFGCISKTDVKRRTVKVVSCYRRSMTNDYFFKNGLGKKYFNIHVHNNKNLQQDCEDCRTCQVQVKRAKAARQDYRLDIDEIISGDEHIYLVDLQKGIMEMFKSIVFTKRLTVYNKSFVPVGIKNILHSVACFWHEGIRGRNREDIVSTFCKFLLTAARDIKYFEPGHTFMSADSFHHCVEKSLYQLKKVYNFEDFKAAVQNSSSRFTVVQMELRDFLQWDFSDTLNNLGKGKNGIIPTNRLQFRCDLPLEANEDDE
ncbi:hypothetical protein PR048_010193 [Dryococelus australis]|uniref:Uncharacterized protein n=1 Tax=Dryococelus australis TaxID=614101 RepID=A0ABQ9I213_9NEOP|nr:hypothetical protein PR048_010193 [Dryococelus australis]